MTQTLFIINPVAGGENKDSLIAQIKEQNHKKEVEADLYKTSGEDDIKQIENLLNENKYDRIIVGGGDGTIKMVSEILYKLEEKIPLAILPLGSANGLATSLGIPENEQEALDFALRTEKAIDFDLLQINDKHLCVHLFDLGINANLVKFYDETDSRGMLGYTKHALKALKESSTRTFAVITGDETVKMSGKMLLCTNANKFGSGVALTKGKPTDGLFDIRIIPKINLEELVKGGLSMLDLFSESELFEDIIQSNEAKIEVDSDVPLQIDGEYIGEFSELRVKVLPSALKLMVPHDYE